MPDDGRPPAWWLRIRQVNDLRKLFFVAVAVQAAVWTLGALNQVTGLFPVLSPPTGASAGWQSLLEASFSRFPATLFSLACAYLIWLPLRAPAPIETFPETDDDVQPPLYE